MKCCICGEDMVGYGNNPRPICAPDDFNSRCCNRCNELVVQARIMQQYDLLREIQPNDKIVVLYTKDSTKPIDMLRESGKFLAGYVDVDEQLQPNIYYGTWGNFKLNTKTDSYINLGQDIR